MAQEKIATASESVNEAKASSSNQLNSKVMKTKEKSTTRKNGSELRESKGNMYDFVTHTWNPIKGKCEHECAYCYVSKMVKNQKPIRLEEKAMNTDLEKGLFIFVGSGTDMFAESVSSEWITKVLDYCDRFDNRYLFQSKNPERFMDFIDHPVFDKSVICTTIESNRNYDGCQAPSIENRVAAIEMIKAEKKDIKVYVTIEPIMDFDSEELVALMKRCQPEQVNIGAESKGKTVQEPSRDKVLGLIAALSTFTKVIEKKNLKKSMTDPMEKELKQAKKETATSREMKVEIMERTASGYTIKEENRKFGLIRENRPINKTQVDGFLQIIHNGKYDDSQSIVTAEATELMEKYNIMDLEGNPIAEQDAKDYLIVLDGQHRITAFSKLNAINQITIPNVHIKKGIENIREYLADINLIGRSWNTADKICVAAISTENPLLKKINEMIKDGYNASTAVLICTGKKVTPTQLKEILTKGDTSCLEDENGTTKEKLERARIFVTTAMSIEGMTMKILTKRYYIKGFNTFAKENEGCYDTAFAALGKLTVDDFKSAREDLAFYLKLNEASKRA